jgi:hypothetical protein
MIKFSRLRFANIKLLRSFCPGTAAASRCLNTLKMPSVTAFCKFLVGSLTTARHGSCLRVHSCRKHKLLIGCDRQAVHFWKLLHLRSSGGPEYELTGKAAPAPEADEGGKGGVPVVDPVVLVQVVRAGKPLPTQLQHK